MTRQAMQVRCLQAFHLGTGAVLSIAASRIVLENASAQMRIKSVIAFRPAAPNLAGVALISTGRSP
jgi:hypothetical protein